MYKDMNFKRFTYGFKSWLETFKGWGPPPPWAILVYSVISAQIHVCLRLLLIILALVWLGIRAGEKGGGRPF